jgi:hypothetical protein
LQWKLKKRFSEEEMESDSEFFKIQVILQNIVN